MTGFVVDASVALAWCFEDEVTAESDALLDRARTDGVVVPAHWTLEVANTLLVAQRKQRIDSARAVAFAVRLQRLPISVDSRTHDLALSETHLLASTTGLSSYDAAYLELARRRGLPLATKDRRLASAASSAGVQVLPA